MKLLKTICLATAVTFVSAPVNAGFLDDLAKKATNAPVEEKKSTLETLGGMESIKNMAKTGKLDTNALIKDLVDQQCRNQLNARQEWKLVSMVMSSSKKRAWEDKVCGCATEETVNSTSSDDLVKIANPSTRNSTIAKITTKAVKACVARLR